MSLKSRVRRIEAAVTAVGACSFCRGVDRSTLRVWIKGDPEPPVPSCPQCGRPARAVTTVIIESDRKFKEETAALEYEKTIVMAGGTEYQI